MESQDSMRVLKGVIKAFLNAGFEVVMEGVEAKEQSNIAKSFHINYIQGYLYSKLKPIREFLLFSRIE